MTDGRRRLFTAFREHGVDAQVRFGPDLVTDGQPIPRLFIGLKTAFHRGQPELAGTWVPVEKTLRFDPRPKREPTRQRRRETFIRTVPAMNGDAPSPFGVMPRITKPSAPYRKLAAKDEDKHLHHDQPDHVDGQAQLVGDD